MKISELWRRVRVFAARDRWTRDLDDEMRLHIELREQSYRERGMPTDAARLAARRRFGNTLVMREAARDVWNVAWLESFWKDAVYSTRRLLRDRAASVAMVLTLALGIGANTAMFTLLDRVLFKPAPVANPASLVWLLLTDQRSGRVQRLSYPAYRAFAKHPETFSGVAAFASRPFSLGGDVPARINGLVVSGNYFDVLGVPARIGRTFLADEDGAPGAHPVAVLSHALWTNRFGADPGIAGQSMVLNGRRFTIVGVAPPGFGGLELEPASVWVPLAMADVAIPAEPRILDAGDTTWLHAVGRLQPDVSTRDASAVVDVVARQLARPDSEARIEGRAAVVSGSLDPQNRGSSAPALGMLSIVPLLVLGVACANAGNLLLSRGLARRKELALRKALGAGRVRLVRQLLVESVLLSLVACAAGVLFSYALTSGIITLAEVPAEIGGHFKPDARVMIASAVLAIMAGLAVGLAPALVSTDAALVPALKGSEISVGAGGRRRGLRSVFLVAQVTVSFVLVIVAGLFLQSVSKALSVDPGFEPRGVVVLAFDPELQGYDANGRQRLHDSVLRDVAGLPGVESVALSTALPLAGRMYGTAVTREPLAGEEELSRQANFASISPRYFETMQISIVAGRDFSERDTRSSSSVAMVNDTLAARLWANASPIGRRLRFAGEDGWREIVGVVRGGKYDEFSEEPRAFFFVPDAQVPLGRVSLVARTSTEPAAMIEPVRQAVRALDPNMPLFDADTLDRTIRNAVDRQRGAASILALFGALGLLLAAFGLYAVVSQTVALRTREIGIRISLGARPSGVLMSFVCECLALCAIGIIIGGGVSLALSGVLGSFLYGLHPSDAITYVAAAGLFLGVAATASLLPARRASRIDPLAALRCD